MAIEEPSMNANPPTAVEYPARLAELKTYLEKLEACECLLREASAADLAHISNVVARVEHILTAGPEVTPAALAEAIKSLGRQAAVGRNAWVVQPLEACLGPIAAGTAKATFDAGQLQSIMMAAYKPIARLVQRDTETLELYTRDGVALLNDVSAARAEHEALEQEAGRLLAAYKALVFVSDVLLGSQADLVTAQGELIDALVSGEEPEPGYREALGLRADSVRAGNEDLHLRRVALDSRSTKLQERTGELMKVETELEGRLGEMERRKREVGEIADKFKVATRAVPATAMPVTNT
ncbi:hypothetical protein Q8F55_001515 [Vanrija albida]|uniref:Uncharacterized protein n=1 Tax=Vanrija albida TaxID=181172 RepID=A0ABR3QH34_9TREE